MESTIATRPSLAIAAAKVATDVLMLYLSAWGYLPYDCMSLSNTDVTARTLDILTAYNLTQENRYQTIVLMTTNTLLQHVLPVMAIEAHEFRAKPNN